MWIALALILAWPAQAFAAIPNGQTTDPLERGVLMALGSVYRVETTVSVAALRTSTGQLFPLGPLHTVTELGTAFAVAPGGVLVTDAHVVSPSGASLAIIAAPLALAQHGMFGDQAAYEQWVQNNGVVPVGVRVLRVRVLRATANPHTPATEVPAHLIRGSLEQTDDLALLQIADHHVPALHLNQTDSIGTAAAVIGYGVATPTTLGLPTTTVPGIKTGHLGVLATVKWLPGQQFTFIDSAIARGDSGGPAVDAKGDAHGIVRFKNPGGGGLLDQASPIFRLLTRLGISNTTGPIATDFATGMTDLWTHKLTEARDALTRTNGADKTHPLAAQELAVVTQLQHAPPAPAPSHWWRAFFLGLATLTGIAAALCAVRWRKIARVGAHNKDAAPHFPSAP
jgi:S1-C subfamily serine protease